MPTGGLANDLNMLYQNLSYTSELLNLEVKFIWRPMIDEALYSLIESLLQVNNQKPSFLVMGMATEYMMMNASGKETALEYFKSNLTNLVDMINDVNYDNVFFETSINSPRRVRNRRAPTVKSPIMKNRKF